jgi:uncharacterized protein (UPF0332 family)
MSDVHQVFLIKAEESLAGAEDEFTRGRYNNCANRCYYCCFQGAIWALSEARIRPVNSQAGWGHAFVQAQFVGQLINRRKLYPSGLRETLTRLLVLRHVADYATDSVSQTQASRALRRARGRKLMNATQFNPSSSPQVEAALSQLQALVRVQHPTATFTIASGEDPDGVYLLASVDVEDTDVVIDAVIDYLLDVQIEQGLPVYVIPLRPLERIEASLRSSSVGTSFF